MYDYQKEELAGLITDKLIARDMTNKSFCTLEINVVIRDILDDYFKDIIADGWSIEDVRTVAKEAGYEVSDDVAREVLEAVDHNYDANRINWDILTLELMKHIIKRWKNLAGGLLKIK